MRRGNDEDKLRRKNGGGEMGRREGKKERGKERRSGMRRKTFGGDKE